MARPKKHNADYFSHSVNMRNDPRIRALRNKCGLEGYAVWNFILEIMSDSDFFRIEWSEQLSIEILAGDFDIETDSLVKIVDYCLTLKLLQKEDGFLVCQRLSSGFEGLVTKRENRAKKVVSDVQNDNKGTDLEGFGHTKPQTSEVSDVQNTHSIVQYSTVKNSIVNIIKNYTLSNERGNFEILKSDREIFEMFRAWVDVNAPKVNEMPEPFTEQQAIQLMVDFRGEFIEDLLRQMHNDKVTMAKKTSADMTFREWAKRRDIKPEPKTTEIKTVLWNYCTEEIQKQVSVEVFNELFRDVVPLEFDGVALRLRVSSKELVQRIDRDYTPILRPIIQRAFGASTILSYAVLKMNLIMT